MKYNWETKLGIALVAFSIFVYGAKTILIGKVEDTYLYVINSLGFLPINVLLVTLILNKLLNLQAKKAKLEKLNMVISTFFSEMGTTLLSRISRQDKDIEPKRRHLLVNDDWTTKEFRLADRELRGHEYEINLKNMDIQSLRTMLLEKRNFLLRLLENPVLLEHETFTDVLRAVFHLTEELERREKQDNLPDSDIEHLQGDFKRVYERIVPSWLQYMKYQKDNYPYLFSLAVRTNPFDLHSSPIVK